MNCTIYTRAMLQKSPQKSRLRVPRSLLKGRPRSRDCIGGAGAFGIPSIVVARITGRRLGFLKVTRLSIPHDGSGRASRGPERGSAPDALGRGRTASVSDSGPRLMAGRRAQDPDSPGP